MWFEELTGFREISPRYVRQNMSCQGNTLLSHANGRKFEAGVLEIPTLARLRARSAKSLDQQGPGKLISIREIVADVQSLHLDQDNSGAMFQVASQFNLLEMISPQVTPEQGITGYAHDLTQGPACAMAAAAGTIYRNYFVPLNGQQGQSTDSQIDCLSDIARALDNTGNRLWKMQNGYALASKTGLEEITAILTRASEADKDNLRKLLRIGIQSQTEVTLENCDHKISQCYCSALPVAYSGHPVELWKEFAQLVLQASYEATFCAALANYERTGNNKLYLTLLGGGAFGNEPEWIIGAIARALDLFRNTGLDVVIVSHGHPNGLVRQLISRI